MLIRFARPSDASDIAGIYAAEADSTVVSFRNQPKTQDEVEADLSHKEANGYPVLIAEDEATFLGFASYGTFRDTDGYRFTKEHSVFLVPEAQGKGVGRALMAELERVALKRGVRTLVAAIGSENVSSIEFHEKIGFTEVGRMPGTAWKLGDWLDLVLMQKRI